MMNAEPVISPTAVQAWCGDPLAGVNRLGSVWLYMTRALLALTARTKATCTPSGRRAVSTVAGGQLASTSTAGKGKNGRVSMVPVFGAPATAFSTRLPATNEG